MFNIFSTGLGRPTNKSKFQSLQLFHDPISMPCICRSLTSRSQADSLPKEAHSITDSGKPTPGWGIDFIPSSRDWERILGIPWVLRGFIGTNHFRVDSRLTSFDDDLDIIMILIRFYRYFRSRIWITIKFISNINKLYSLIFTTQWKLIYTNLESSRCVACWLSTMVMVVVLSCLKGCWPWWWVDSHWPWWWRWYQVKEE